MTICIVATCEITPPQPKGGGLRLAPKPVPGIVAISDLQLSTSYSTYQPDQPKSFGFGTSIRCWFAGSPGDCHEIVDLARKQIGSAPTVREVAQAVSNEFVGARKRKAVVANQIDPRVKPNSVTMDSQLIVAGVDDGQSAIYTIDDERPLYRADTQGFAIIGSGWQHAVAYLNRIQFARHWALPEALFALFVAKRLAETDLFVGPELHPCILRRGREILWSPNLVKDLERSYQAMLKAERRAATRAGERIGGIMRDDFKRYFLELDRPVI